MLDVWVIAPEDLPIPPVRGGSVQIYAFALVKHLSHYKNLSITLISPSAKTNYTYLKLPKAGFQHYVVANNQGRYMKNVINLVHKAKPHIIQIENRPKILRAIRVASPESKIILNLHSTTFIHPKRITHDEAVWSLTNANQIVYNSQYLMNQVQNRFKSLHGKLNQIVIYPGVDLQRFIPPNHRIIHSPIRILYVGRVIRQKGLHVLLRALPYLTKKNLDIELTVIGRTPPWEVSYQKFVHSLSRHQPVKWKGFVKPNELIKYYQQADVFVCPSQKNEAFGLVNIEAMATGLPVIVSNVGGMAESVAEPGGSIINNYQFPFGFAEAISSLVGNSELWRTKTVAARNRAQQFSWQNTAERFNHLYRTICT